MNIIRETIPTMSLERFCDTHGFSVKLTERSTDNARYTDHRYWATLVPFTERMEDGMLAAIAGNGNTEAEALHALGREISERRLAVEAYTPQRREIQAPRIVEEG